MCRTIGFLCRIISMKIWRTKSLPLWPLSLPLKYGKPSAYCRLESRAIFYYHTYILNFYLWLVSKGKDKIIVGAKFPLSSCTIATSFFNWIFLLPILRRNHFHRTGSAKHLSYNYMIHALKHLLVTVWQVLCRTSCVKIISCKRHSLELQY